MGQNPAVGVGGDIKVLPRGLELCQLLADLGLALPLVELLEHARDGCDAAKVVVFCLPIDLAGGGEGGQDLGSELATHLPQTTVTRRLPS